MVRDVLHRLSSSPICLWPDRHSPTLSCREFPGYTRACRPLEFLPADRHIRWHWAPSSDTAHRQRAPAAVRHRCPRRTGNTHRIPIPLSDDNAIYCGRACAPQAVRRCVSTYIYYPVRRHDSYIRPGISQTWDGDRQSPGPSRLAIRFFFP